MSDETPAPRREVEKLERNVCAHCGLKWPAPVVVDGRCTNRILCQLRFNRAVRRRKREGGK